MPPHVSDNRISDTQYKWVWGEEEGNKRKKKYKNTLSPSMLKLNWLVEMQSCPWIWYDSCLWIRKLDFGSAKIFAMELSFWNWVEYNLVVCTVWRLFQFTVRSILLASSRLGFRQHSFLPELTYSHVQPHRRGRAVILFVIKILVFFFFISKKLVFVVTVTAIISLKHSVISRTCA